MAAVFTGTAPDHIPTCLELKKSGAALYLSTITFMLKR